MDTISQLISQLPVPAQKQVQEFVEFLLSKYKKSSKVQSAPISYPLAGSVLKYEDPFGSASNDWEALT